MQYHSERSLSEVERSLEMVWSVKILLLRSPMSDLQRPHTDSVALLSIISSSSTVRCRLKIQITTKTSVSNYFFLKIHSKLFMRNFYFKIQFFLLHFLRVTSMKWLCIDQTKPKESPLTCSFSTFPQNPLKCNCFFTLRMSNCLVLLDKWQYIEHGTRGQQWSALEDTLVGTFYF